MRRKKLDARIRTVVENGVARRHRSLFVVVGEKAGDQVPTLYSLLANASHGQRPSVLWCYQDRDSLSFSSHRQKRIGKIEASKKDGTFTKEKGLFEEFITKGDLKYCYYDESTRILGNEFGMVVLQDFKSLTPNLLARTIETTKGGGIVVILLQTDTSLKQIYTLSMDVHKRYRTEAHQDVVPRFNERFILSLGSCPGCLVIDDCLNVLPIATSIQKISHVPFSAKAKSERQMELEKLQTQMSGTHPIGDLLRICRTHCQARVLLRLLDAMTERHLRTGITCSLTAARGRGKSAAMGLSIAGAVALGLTGIYVTSPSVENIRTLFNFVLKGMATLGYEEHVDFAVLADPCKMPNHLNKSEKCIKRITIHRGNHRQIIQYLAPDEACGKLGQAELLVIDEAAAIPIPIIRELISGPYTAFLASTISGYEGTGRSLSLKLLEQLRQQARKSGEPDSVKNKSDGASEKTGGGGALSLASRTLHELTLEESIRYGDGDPVEDWLNRLLCLNPVSLKFSEGQGIPPPAACELFYVNRDSLFSFHPGAERFLAQLMSIYVSAHYKNTPDDLHMLSDAPAHHLFVLMGPIPKDQTAIPHILAVVQCCLEGSLSREHVRNVQDRGRRVAGDMIPWTLVQHFLDADFSGLCGARVVRVAVHPEYQRMGYGTRAIELLKEHYGFESEGNRAYLSIEKSRGESRLDASFFEVELDDDLENDDDDFEGNNDMVEDEDDVEMDVDDHNDHDKNGKEEEIIAPRSNLPPLLQRSKELRAERLDWIGVSFGLTLPLLKFWKKKDFVPVYVRQTASDLTGEHTCIAISVKKGMRESNAENGGTISQSASSWLSAFYNEFRRRFMVLLATPSIFGHFSPALALSLLFRRANTTPEGPNSQVLSREQLRLFLADGDLRRLTQFAKNVSEANLIMDLLPTLASLYFTGRIDHSIKLDLEGAAMLLAVGLQRKSIEKAAHDLLLRNHHASLNKAVRRLSEHFDNLCREAIERDLLKGKQLASQSSTGSNSSFLKNELAVTRALPVSLDDEDIAERQQNSDDDEHMLPAAVAGKGFALPRGSRNKKRAKKSMQPPKKKGLKNSNLSEEGED